MTVSTGYIGGYTAVILAKAGSELTLLDNLSNSKAEVVNRLETILGERPAFVQGDIRDAELLEEVLRSRCIEAVGHFAGLKAIGESVEEPLTYFENNVVGAVSLLKAMHAANVKSLVFSSS